MKQEARWTITSGSGALVATAIHDGHAVRPEVAEGLALTDTQRLREEDPFTGVWTAVADTRIVVHRSRFEVDLNRPREGAVYIRPEDAWGLNVWKERPEDTLIERSRDQYDDFYREVRAFFADMEARHGRFVVFDLHTYNHRREGPDGPVADPVTNPQVNIGTGTMDRTRWGPLTDRFIKDLGSAEFMGAHLDVRENVKFRGGAFPRWIHGTFPHSACAIAVEFKKVFMDEWSGQPDTAAIEALSGALASTIPGVLEELSLLWASRRDVSSKVITDELITVVATRLSEGKRVRRTLPGQGRLHIDRQLPFLCVYRRGGAARDEGTASLVEGEAAYLVAPASRTVRPQLTALLRSITTTLAERFGAFLIVEIWAADDPPHDATGAAIRRPAFRVVTDGDRMPPDAVEALHTALKRVKVTRLGAQVSIDSSGKPAPRQLPRLLSAAECEKLGCSLLGVEVSPVYRDADGAVFPFLLRALHRGLNRALKELFFEFAKDQTSYRQTTSLALGRRALVKAAWKVDENLAKVSDSFDYLLLVTPVNANQAWKEFHEGGFLKAPTLRYRPRPLDPAMLKRRLYDVPIEKLEDPVIAQLFRDKRDELDRQLSMLRDRSTRGFRFESLELYGPVSADLLTLAEEILEKTSMRSREGDGSPSVRSEAFAEAARAEIEEYRRILPGLASTVQVRDDVNGLMVSRGHLLVGRDLRVSHSRVDPLIQHEVGTHIVTYVNGRGQPFRQLYSGLPGYDELQEGLAVLAEYLVGGLTVPRLRLLAARVVAVHRMGEGVQFPDVFQELNGTLGFRQRTAFNITVRVFRGGGLAKDAAYLRGLVRLLHYIGSGGELDPLYVGKIGVEHIPVIQELLARGVLRPPPLRPRFLERAEVKNRLSALREGASVLDLIPGRI